MIQKEEETIMKRAFVLLVMVLLVTGLAVTGCGSKKTAAGGTGTAADAGNLGTVDESPVKWSYDTAPNPAFTGTADYRLTSFGFDEGAAIMRSEGMGACREAVKKLADKSTVKILTVGFADGIKETNKAEALGLQRAEAAKRFLGTLGIKPDQIQVASFGSHYSTAKDFEKIKLASERKAEIWLLQ
jgi:outer membrane protein OmpA-like peptidoglycan-associated protein